MSPREKKLLIFFAIAGFFVLNFLAIGFFKSKRGEVDRQRDQARQKLETAEMFRASREQVDRPDGVARQTRTGTGRQPGCADQAPATLQERSQSHRPDIKSQKPLPTETAEGLHFHRAKIQITVNGTEEALYRWFDRLNIPDNCASPPPSGLSPNTKDDTKIDCTATIEQWFVPLPPP